jgi:hypothetical protein
MHNVKLIRMQTGEDIMASMYEQEDNTQVQLNDPMRLVFRRMPTGQTVMMMMPWLPVELIKENTAMVYTSDIITIIEPKETMILYYDKLVERTIKEMEESDELLQNLLDEEEPKYEEDDGPLTENQLEQILNDIRTKKLH